jgi:hypothetical protein
MLRPNRLQRVIFTAATVEPSASSAPSGVCPIQDSGYQTPRTAGP